VLVLVVIVFLYAVVFVLEPRSIPNALAVSSVFMVLYCRRLLSALESSCIPAPPPVVFIVLLLMMLWSAPKSRTPCAFPVVVISFSVMLAVTAPESSLMPRLKRVLVVIVFLYAEEKEYN